MKKAILVLGLIILGIYISGCTEQKTIDPNLTGTWVATQGSNTQEISFNGEGTFSLTTFFEGEQTSTLLGEYYTIENKLYMIFDAPSYGPKEQVGTYIISENKLTVDSDLSSVAIIVAYRK